MVSFWVQECDLLLCEKVKYECKATNQCRRKSRAIRLLSYLAMDAIAQSVWRQKSTLLWDGLSNLLNDTTRKHLPNSCFLLNHPNNPCHFKIDVRISNFSELNTHLLFRTSNHDRNTKKKNSAVTSFSNPKQSNSLNSKARKHNLIRKNGGIGDDTK